MAKNITMEELLASQPQKLATFHRGQEVEGQAVVVSDKEIILDLGGKSEGVLPVRGILETVLKNLKVGSKLKAYVSMAESENGQIILSSSPQMRINTFFKGHGINWSRFLNAQNQKSKLQGKVREINKGGLIVEVEGARGFLPNSQVGFELLTKVGKGKDALIGQDLTITVIEIDTENNKLIFSQRGQVTPEAKEKLKSFKAGQKENGKIVAILPFGLVVDISGAEGLVFIADVSWEKVEDLSSGFKVGDEIEVMVLGLDEELGRLNLSIKQLTEDPFATLVKNYPADEVVKGEIISVGETGVTLKLKDGIEGFLPASKMGQVTYEIGKIMSFLVDSVDVGRRRINLAPFVTSTAGLIYK